MRLVLIPESRVCGPRGRRPVGVTKETRECLARNRQLCVLLREMTASR